MLKDPCKIDPSHIMTEEEYALYKQKKLFPTFTFGNGGWIMKYTPDEAKNMEKVFKEFAKLEAEMLYGEYEKSK